jgi:hypothetical protein
MSSNEEEAPLGAIGPLLRMLRLTYPDGLPDRDYFPFLALIRETTCSSRAIADLLVAFQGGEAALYYYDLVHELPTQAVPESEKDRVRALLDLYGYSDWARSN